MTIYDDIFEEIRRDERRRWLIGTAIASAVTVALCCLIVIAVKL